MNSMRSDARARGALSIFGAFLLLAVALAYGPTASADPAPVVAASPAPGIAYDEIARVVQPGSTPPPIGTFGEDAAVIAALPPLVVPKDTPLNTTAISLLAMVPNVGWFLAKGAAVTEIAAHKAALDKQKDEYSNGRAVRQRTGVLAKFAYYGGWSRVELSPGFATIDKPDQGLTMTLDNARKTYRSVRSAPAVETFTVTSAAAAGTAALDGTPTVEQLPPARIEGLAARGYRTTGSIAVSRASFLCAAGPHHVTETEYVSDLTDARFDAAQDAATAQPLVTACALGTSFSHRQPGRLVLYRTIAVDDGTPTAFGIALERGNIRTISEHDVAMFQPPPDFTEKR